MTLKNIFIATILLAAVGASWLLLKRPPADDSAGDQQSATGYYLRGAVIEGTDLDGSRLYTLTAGTIRQQPVGNSVTLQDVDLEFAGGDEQPWRLTADSGSIPAAGDLIELFGNVQLEETLFIGPEKTIVRTPELAVDLRAKLATTDAEVRIERGNYLLEAVGLRADLKDRKLSLQSKVHGNFLP